ncbi:transglutaminaseTgpA domain-containing protein [Actinomadura madurae]|nr:transglutaminaseTgpA domain-containing protein [Actinomadura madurae]MCP9965585.1 transglutaminaseTgpA domain-containing protein [Actinomadura madurae]
MTRYVSLAVTACLVAVSGLAFQRVFGIGPVVPVVAVAAAVPTLLCGLLSGPRKAKGPWPLWISLVLTVVAWAGTVSVTVLRPALGDGTLPQTLREGVLGSWKSILTTLLPAPAKPEFLVLVNVVVWLAAFASAELALRTSLRAAPGVPALAVWAVALLLGVDGPGTNLPLAAATVVLIAVLVLVRADGPGTGIAWRPLVIGVPAAGVLGGLAFAAGPVVPVSAEPYNPREQVEAPPPQQRDSVSPLDRVGGWLLSPDQVMFTVEAKRNEIERLAVLDRFDGVTWSSTARFVPTGSRVPEGRPRTGSTRSRSASRSATCPACGYRPPTGPGRSTASRSSSTPAAARSPPPSRSAPARRTGSTPSCPNGRPTISRTRPSRTTPRPGPRGSCRGGPAPRGRPSSSPSSASSRRPRPRAPCRPSRRPRCSPSTSSATRGMT